MSKSENTTTWRFDNFQQIGGVRPRLIGTPSLVDTSIGKAMRFLGSQDRGDAIFLDALPLSGARFYTWEVIFRPLTGGCQEQRFFHLQEAGSDARRLFELRILDNRWCLDSFAASEPVEQPGNAVALLRYEPQYLFPLDLWYTVAAVYDGDVLRSYVNGSLQMQAQVRLPPLGAGASSVGTRFTMRDYFSGDILLARFTDSALGVQELLRTPASIV